MQGEWFEGHPKVVKFLKEHGCERPALLLEATQRAAELEAELAALGYATDGARLPD
jgi:hypothetical protein